MITEIHASVPGPSPRGPSVVASKPAPGRPAGEDIPGSAGKPGPALLPGGHGSTPESLPVLGGVDGHDTASGPETPPDFPYLKPLAEAHLGNRVNTLG